MTRLKSILMCGAAAGMMAAATPAGAATIVLVDQGGVKGSAAELGFNLAAKYWGSILTNDVTIRLGVKFATLDRDDVIGQTGSTRADFSVANWEAGVNATRSNSTLDQNIVLPGLNGNGGATFITNGTNAQGNDDVTTFQVINGDSTSSRTLYLNTSVIKAIGGSVNPNALDGNVTFNTKFNFDFNSADGISAGMMDFLAVAIHEIGHALGFVSGVDLVDYYGVPDGPGRPGGPGKGYHVPVGYTFNDTSIYSALDMFRYSNDPNNLVPGSDGVLDLSVGGAKYFSIDGGKTALFGNTFSTGYYQGDGNQASHWGEAPGCTVGPGIMDPNFCYGQMGVITNLDLAAFDAMGWNLSVDALKNYRRSTKDIFVTGVPEPGTWAMMILGFGMVGGMMRRRPARVRVSFV